ncbi:MAG TPA: type II toxin-antitoxin system Phd/YefM family antitoxin [Treponemataceae bacterium]|nr:type II toxin-antitoxin system Phd/YefM family antitoxin [Treponemataceae bacterium]
MTTWTLQDAKARFSELVNDTISGEPCVVTRHGKDAVVVIAADQYRAIFRKQGALSSFFASAPRVELDISRPREFSRDVDL